MESGTWVANLPGGRVLATAAESASRVLMYDLYGRLIEGLNLGGTYEAFPTAIRIGETIWLSAADQWVQGDYNYHCPCGLVVWEVE